MKQLDHLTFDGVFLDVVNSIGDGVYIIDRERRIVFWNQAAEEISGFKSEEVLHTSCADNVLNHVDENGLALCRTVCPAARCLEDGQSRQASVFLHHKNGHRVPVNIVAHPIREEGRIVGVFEIFKVNNHDRMFLEGYHDLQKKAYVDDLTGAWNKRHLLDSLEVKLDQLRRFGWVFAVAFLDLDHFKMVNDSFGHQTGDKVLKMVCNTIASNSRNIDELHRYGGEELVLVLPGVHLDWQLHAIGEKIRALVENSFLQDKGPRISVTMSIGMTYASPEDTVDSLLHRADTTMYAAKQSGRNRVCIDSDGRQQ